MKRGKKYTEAAKLVDRMVQYDVAEAISLVKKTAVSKLELKCHWIFRFQVMILNLCIAGLCKEDSSCKI